MGNVLQGRKAIIWHSAERCKVPTLGPHRNASYALDEGHQLASCEVFLGEGLLINKIRIEALHSSIVFNCTNISLSRVYGAGLTPSP